MDTSETTSSALDTNQAAAEFAKILDPQPAAQPQAEEPVAAEPVKADSEVPEPATVDEAVPDEDGATITIEVDGKTVELTKAELAEHYKNGLRQADYTKKTMETAEQRKAAEAEKSKAVQERQQYAQGLQQAQSLLQAQLHEQSQIDWQQLLNTDPVEYLKQQHLANARQAQLQRVHQEQQQLHARSQAEQAQQMHAFLATQQQELLAKLPEWKDEAKAQAGREAIKGYLKAQGVEESQINNITDHRVVVLAHKAMQYDEMMAKAQAAAKKVSNLPQRVERTGGGNVNALDGRTAAMKQLSRSGKVEDAARVFANLL